MGHTFLKSTSNSLLKEFNYQNSACQKHHLSVRSQWTPQTTLTWLRKFHVLLMVNTFTYTAVYIHKHLLWRYAGLLYTYMAEGSDNSSGGGAFCALQRGFVHWSCGCLDHIEMNVKHPKFCHSWCKVMPSMKTGLYQVTLLLGRDDDITNICRATCKCVAGYVHIYDNT